MLFSIKEEGGCKIGAYTSRAAELNLRAVKMRVKQGKKVFYIIALYSVAMLRSLYMDRGCSIIVENSSTYTCVEIGL
jgi:hypothetical protein